ncbi:MAG: hypothetical protein P4L62_04970 [Candidatus Pacebacteria bacterium]|nr:hypothetical protein [Candidatus Paceibacterota bacterium]MDR3583673.1 hypothetical protein [Candidatus Paceibacterota bacterium]
MSILKKAFTLTWKNRYLWWYGFFITLSGVGSFNYLFNNNRNGRRDLVHQHAIGNFISQNTHWLVIGAIIILILYAIFLILGIIARGALIDSLGKRLKDENSTFRSGFNRGRRFFGRIALVAILMDLFALASIIVLIAPVAFLFLSQAYLVGVFMGILAVIILVPILLLAYYLKTYAYIYAVLGDLRFWPAIERAYVLLQENILASLIMGLIFIPISLALAIAIIMAAIPIFIIFLGIGLVLYLLLGQMGIIVTVILGFICFFIFLFLIRSAYEVFAQAVWLIFFRQIASPKVKEAVTEPEPEIKVAPKAMPIIDIEKSGK